MIGVYKASPKTILESHESEEQAAAQKASTYE